VGKIEWLDDVAEHDYAAAAAYLPIKLAADAVQKIVKKLKTAPVVTRRANDVLRAAGTGSRRCRRAPRTPLLRGDGTR
jgi:hypothetical protein